VTATPADPIRVALVGCGAMGARHARVISADPGAELAAVVDIVPERAARIAQAYGTRPASSVPREIDAVVVATPTTTHVHVAGDLLARGLWCLVEKPLAEGSSAAKSLGSARCAVGHVERFNPAVRAAGAVRPQVVEARRISPPTGRGEDVDVVVDLMIHDLDLVLGWARPGAEVAWVDAAGVRSPRTGALDVASVRLRTTCGMTATLLASRVAERRQRMLCCYEPGRSTVLDLLAGRARRNGADLEPPDSRDGLTAQWQGFTAAVRGGAPPPGIGAGIRALEVAERVKDVVRSET
jgi:predicted dehydrogenase